MSGWTRTWMPLSTTTLTMPYLCGELLFSAFWCPLICNSLLFAFREGNGSSNSGKGNTNWPVSCTPIEFRAFADWHVKLGLLILNHGMCEIGYFCHLSWNPMSKTTYYHHKCTFYQREGRRDARKTGYLLTSKQYAVVVEVNKSAKLCITMEGKKVYIDRKIPRG